MKHLKPLDIVATKSSSIGMVTDVLEDGKCSITFIYRNPATDDKYAWWGVEELTLLNSIPNLLAKAVSHPFGSSVNPYSLDQR